MKKYFLSKLLNEDNKKEAVTKLTFKMNPVKGHKKKVL